MLIAWHNNNNVSMNFTKNSFTFGQEKYYLDVNITTSAGGACHVKWEIIPSVNTIPCAKLGQIGNGHIDAFVSEFTNVLSSGNIVQANAYQIWTTGVQSVSRVIDNNNTNISVSDGFGFASNTNGQQPYDVNITIDADFPIFAIFSDTPYPGGVGSALKVMNGTNDTLLTNNINNVVYGDATAISGAINYLSVTNEIPVNQVWSVRCLLKKNGSVVGGSNKAYDFRIQPDARIWFVLTNRINGDATANMILHISSSPWLQKLAYAPDNTYTETSVLDDSYWYGNWQDYNTGDAYTGVCSTNIPIFESDAKGDAYGRGEIDEDQAINSGDNSFSRSTIGDDLTASNIPTINMASSGVGVNVYALSEAQIKDIMSNYLYTTDPATQTTISDALWLWGNNPIDFLVDCYYIPFDITTFYSTINANLKFGTYQFTGTSFPVIKETNGNRLTLFNTSFEGVYGNWRDFTQFNYDLYLPFYGFYSLDTYKYLNKTVRCEMMFDLTTHNLRYYLFCDDIITDRIDASVGINIPIMGTDMVNKAKHDRDIKYSVLNDSIGAGASIGMGVTSADFGGALTGVVSGVGHIINGVKQYQELNTRASQNVVGGFSSAMNTYDIMYAYLRITERQIVIPANINNIYNYPSYYMGALSSLNGYCEIEDVQLLSNATEEEQEEIKGLLRGGVIF